MEEAELLREIALEEANGDLQTAFCLLSEELAQQMRTGFYRPKKQASTREDGPGAVVK